MGGERQSEQQLRCSICKELPRTVMEANCCNSVVCKSCVLSLLKQDTSSECPNCSNTKVHWVPNVPLQRVVNQQRTKCKFTALGCSEVLSFVDLEEHENSCEWSLLECPNQCGMTLSKKELTEHQESQCSLRIVKCPHCEKSMPHAYLTLHSHHECDFVKTKCSHCFKEIKRKGLDNHISNKCPEIFVSCPYGQCGCCEKMKRKQLAAHLDTSTKFHLQLVLKTVNKQQEQIGMLNTELAVLRNQKSTSLVDMVQDTADCFADSLSRPKVPSWIAQWEKCDLNIMYFWIAGFSFLQFLLMRTFVLGVYVSSGTYLSFVIYGIFMGYYSFIHSMADVAWYMKFAVSCYFILAWLVLSAVVV